MGQILPFDPVKRAKEIENIVVDKGKRKYYRFRATGFYGGIATADTVGCCFLCAYCWNLGRNLHPGNAGHLFSAEEVARRILDIAQRKGLKKVRISGAEPILGPQSFEHLLAGLEIITKEAPFIRFILETNGFILGYDREMARELARFRNILVRVSLKAVHKVKFEKITGARGDFFPYPLQALLNLNEAGARFWLAVMAQFFTAQEINYLENFLSQNRIKVEIEEEELLLYPLVEENLRKRGFRLS